MNRRKLLLFAAASLALLNLPGVENCSDISSMQKVLDVTPPSIPHNFTLTGTVHSVSGPNFFIDDGDLLVSVLNRSEPHTELTPGNKIIISGNFGLKKFDYGNEPYTVARSATILDVGTPPLPVDRKLSDLSGKYDNLRLIQTTGTIIDYRVDDADPNYIRLILKDGSTIMPVSVFTRNTDTIDDMIDARISLVGTFYRTIQGVRRYSNPCITTSLDNIRIVAPPPPPESTPVLERKIYMTPNDILSLGKRRINGTVIAVWQQHHLLLRDDDSRIVRIRLSLRNRSVPKAGRRATVWGYPETDQFNIILNSATIETYEAAESVPETPEPLKSPTDVIKQTQTGSTVFQPAYYGKLVRIRGTIRNLPAPGNTEGRIGMDSDGHFIYLDASSCPEAADGLQLGSVVDATGICLFDMDDHVSLSGMPHVSGLSIVLRGKGDITLVSRPPWMTPMRFLVILTVMAGVLILILFWNITLRVLVERRGRQLARREAETLKARLKTVERTRLATELHDAVVQNLTGAALEIRAAMASLCEAASEAAPHMDIALKTINSSRTELRNCIWDLRNQALEEKDVDEAIRITLQPHLENAKLQIRFNVPRRKIPDIQFHNIISVIRELVVNAVRHGQAKTIRIAGTLDNGFVLFSVTDDGCGFDPKNAPGMEQGHFGIEGVRERAKSMGGTVAIESAPGEGTRFSVAVTLQEENR